MTWNKTPLKKHILTKQQTDDTPNQYTILSDTDFKEPIITNECFERPKRTSEIFERDKPFLKKQAIIFYKVFMTSLMH